MQCSFAKNIKERKERIILLQKNARTLRSFFTFFFEFFVILEPLMKPKKTFLSFLATYKTQKNVAFFYVLF